MGKHKRDLEPGYFNIDIRPDNIIFVEPTGYITGEVVRHELERLKQTIAVVRNEGHKVLILVNIGRITKHTSSSRSAIKQAAELPFERGAAYGGSRMLGMIMQYLQRSIDPERAHYFQRQQDALAYLKGENASSKPNAYRFASLRFIVISLVLLVFFAVATYLSWAYSQQQVAHESQSLFTQKTQQSQAELQKRMDVYEQALYGFRGLFNASNNVERDEFDAYFKSLGLATEFPGFNAISFIKQVTASDLTSYTAAVRKDTSLSKAGYPQFQVYPASTKDIYDVVTYVEPQTTSSNFGFDLSTDPVRLKTLQAARDTGAPEASASITFSGTPTQKGFILSMPIYTGTQPTTVAQRRRQLFGYVNAVFRYDTLFNDALSGISEPGIAIEIHDDQGKLIYASGKGNASDHVVKNSFEVGDRTLDVYFKAPATYGLSPLARRLPNTILNSGVFAVILLTILLVTLLRSRIQAIRLADTMTVDLEHERNLAVENEHKLRISEQALAAEKASVEHKVVERTKELNEARAQLEASLQGLPFGFAILNSTNQLVFSNAALPRILELAQSTDTSLDNLDHLLHTSEYLQQASSARKVLKKSQMLGTKFLDVLFVPIIAEETKPGDVIGTVIIVQDVSEEKALQRSRDEFFSIASHELRTPLTVMRGNSSMILETYKEELKDPLFKEMVTDIHDSSLRLITIVNDFLDMSRLEQGRIKIHIADVDLGAIAAEVMHEFDNMAAKQNIYLKLEAPESPVKLQADKDRVKQILANLIGNALKFTVKGGITIAISSDAITAKLTVSDTGTGIAVESQHLLFHKFQQASDNILTRENSQSTGLGLYISRLIASVMGGTLYLDQSAPGEGSRFVLELPLHPEHPSPIQPESV